ncbi:LemA family protein [Candidatus Woesearchaeota archaeon]|nr:LemA family protein [Candidatus Woesearchaeota archaeon]
MIIWIGIGVGIVALYTIYAYNRFVTLTSIVDNAWSQIDVQLKRRYDLIPNLVESVKGYMKHEKGVLTEITKARASLISGTVADKAKASDQISNALKTIFAVAESYPKLKASKNFLMLQEELAGTESKIAYARQFYNDSVMDLNVKVQHVPSAIIARLFGFVGKEFFKTEGAEREAVKVTF